MARLARMKGVSQAITKLKKITARLAKEHEQNMMNAGLYLQRESQLIVPVRFGDLRRSARTRKSGSGFKVQVRVVYLQDYALYVHENLEARHAPGKTAKFLERPAREKRKQIAAIARGERPK